MPLIEPTPAVAASAPGKVVLFGEHAVNRGQLAIAAAFGLRTRCRLLVRDGERVLLRGAGRESVRTLAELRSHAQALDDALAAQDFATIGEALRGDFFASSSYLLGRVAATAPGLPGLELSFFSDLPIGGGLGSGGAAHVALASALARLLSERGAAPSLDTVGEWAYAGDRVAHGGTASALDTQACLLGGVIELRAREAGRPLAVAPGLRLVVGDTGIKKGSTGSVNARIREWLAADAARLRTFEEMGELALAARGHLAAGRWAGVGALMDRNHALLAAVGASHPRLDALCEAARGAGAFGAKLTGAGGGGAMIALVSDSTAAPVAEAIRATGGTPLEAPVGGAGAAVEPVSFS